MRLAEARLIAAPKWTSASWRSDAIAARRPMTTPPRASPCPQAYFVSEWTT